jgi:hypothetical protein
MSKKSGITLVSSPHFILGSVSRIALSKVVPDLGTPPTNIIDDDDDDDASVSSVFLNLNNELKSKKNILTKHNKNKKLKINFRVEFIFTILFLKYFL